MLSIFNISVTFCLHANFTSFCFTHFWIHPSEKWKTDIIYKRKKRESAEFQTSDCKLKIYWWIVICPICALSVSTFDTTILSVRMMGFLNLRKKNHHNYDAHLKWMKMCSQMKTSVQTWWILTPAHTLGLNFDHPINAWN